MQTLTHCNVTDAEDRLSRNASRAEEIAEILKALAHPLRVRMIAILTEGPEHVGGLARRLEARQAAVSQQLRILRMRNLVSVARAGGRRYYALAEPRLEELIRCMEGCSSV